MTEGVHHTQQRSHPARTLSVLLVAPHVLVREGLRRLVETERRVKVIAQAERCEEGCRLAQQWHPEVIILDLALPELGGVEAIAALKAHAPATAVVALTPSDEPLYRRALLAAGAAAVVRFDGRGHGLLSVLRTFT